MTDAPTPIPPRAYPAAREAEEATKARVDLEDDRDDPARAAEIDSRHHARSPQADPIIPTRPRAPRSPMLWIGALAILVVLMLAAVIGSRF